jgi:hypothetical protein
MHADTGPGMHVVSTGRSQQQDLQRNSSKVSIPAAQQPIITSKRTADLAAVI